MSATIPLLAAPAAPGAGVRVLVDDVRAFKDDRPAFVARSSAEALALLDMLEGMAIDELWLDHDLTAGDTVQPVVDRLVAASRAGAPFRVRTIVVHTANISAGPRIARQLREAGYAVERSYARSIWKRAAW